MKVTEIFTSIQGESTYAGMPCQFIRLSGCNLRCLYCDTKYAYGGGRDLSITDIISTLNRTKGIRLIEITGGEPLIQEETPELLTRIIDSGFKAMIETNGSMSIRDIDRRATIIMDIKTPGSGMSGHINLNNIEELKPSDEVKFVITNRYDYQWTMEFIKRHLQKIGCEILLSPAHNMLEPHYLAQWMIEDNCRARLNLQLHKIIWGSDASGV